MHESTRVTARRVPVGAGAGRGAFPGAGDRFSVEFDPQQITAYNNLQGGSGTLTTEKAGNRAVSTEPQNSMMVFANAKPTAMQAKELIPTAKSGSIYRPMPGLVNNLNDVSQEIIYFDPGTYYMGSDYHAVLPANVKWVYLAPGAYVKGAFRFASGRIKAMKQSKIAISTPVADIGVRGTEFWGGPMDGQYGVLLLEGVVTVSNQAGSVTLSAQGQGTDIPSPLDPPGAVKPWGADKIARAVASVALH